MEQPNEYLLSDDEKGMVQPLVDRVAEVQAETKTLLGAIMRLRKLEGEWILQGDRLVKLHLNGNGAS
jgi:hypothetical protein